MLSFIGVIVLIFIIWKVASLQTQINNLSARFNNKQQVSSNSVRVSTEIDQIEASADQQPDFVTPSSISSNQNQQEVPETAYEPSAILNWLKENWMLKIGVFLIIVGFGWFVSYAFVHNWIGPVGRITLGFLIGAGVTLFGDLRMKKSPSQGGIFLVLGAAILLITVSAARYIYFFFNPFVGLLMVFLIAAYLTLESLRYDRKQLAIASLIVASVAPFIINYPDPEIVNLFLYIGVVTISSIWVMFKKSWREIGALSALVVFLYSLTFGFAANFDESKNIVLAIAYSLAFIFFVANIFSINKFKEAANSNDMFLATINGITIILWTISCVDKEVQSLLLALWMIVFAIGSYLVFQHTRKIEFFYIYALTSVVYLATATAMELQGNALAFAYIFESAVISIAGYTMTSNAKVGQSLALLMIGPAIMVLPSLDPYRWRGNFFDQDFGLILCMGFVLLLVGLFYFFVNKEEKPEEKSGVIFRVYTAMIIVGSFYLYALIWLTLMSIYSHAVAVTISLAIYTIIGIASYFFGKFEDRIVYRNYGAAMILFVVGRLILIDVWEMELAVRIVAFIFIGVLLVATAFIVKGNKKPELINNQ